MTDKTTDQSKVSLLEYHYTSSGGRKVEVGTMERSSCKFSTVYHSKETPPHVSNQPDSTYELENYENIFDTRSKRNYFIFI